MARKEITTTEITSDVTGRTIAVDNAVLPAPVKLTIEGIVDGKPFKKVLSGLDFLPTEWDGIREFAESADHADAPLISFFTPVSAGNGGSKTASARLQHIRAWATANGKKVGEKGRVPADIAREYDAAKPEGYLAPDSE
jgi:hypothetical protein